MDSWIRMGNAGRLPITVGLSLAVWATVASSTPAEQPPTNDGAVYRLAYRFEANQVVHYEVRHTMMIHTRYAGAELTTTNETVSQKHYRVISVDSSGTATLEAVIDHVKMTAKSDRDDPIVFDSRDPATHQPRFQAILESVGKPQARIRVSPRGQLLELTRLGQASASGDAGRSDDDLRTSNFFVVLPEEPVGVGSRWSEQLEIDVEVSRGLKRKVTLKREYELVAVKGSQATLSVKTSLLTPVRDPAVMARLLQRQFRGEVVFDMQLGQMVSRKLEVDQSVIGPFGANSAMRAVGVRTERLRTQPAATREARREP